MPHSYVLFSARFAPLKGGVESFVENISGELAKRGDKVTVVTSRLDGSPEHEIAQNGVQVFRLPASPLMGGRLPVPRHGGLHRALLAELAKGGVDRILVNNRFYSHSIDGLRFARDVGVRAVLLDHGSDYLTLGNGLADAAIREYEHVMTARTKRFQPVYAGISEKSARWLEHFGIHTDLVIPNAIDAEAYRRCASKRVVRSELGLSDDCMLVVFVGRIVPEKGADALVRAAKSFVGESVHFALVGDGAMRTELEQSATSNVSFLGLLDRSDVSAVLQAADLFCLPTRSEGFCTSLLEASACGIPSAITDVGGVHEVMSDASCGIVLDDMSEASVVSGLVSALELGAEGRSEMGARVRSAVENQCSWVETVRKLDAAFEQVERLQLVVS